MAWGGWPGGTGFLGHKMDQEPRPPQTTLVQKGEEGMIIRINEYSDVPIYLQIRNQIVMGISSGELAAGEQLPTVRALSMEIGINTMTVSKAYQILKSEGYILTDRKNGARVRTEISQSKTLSAQNKDELKRIVSEAKIAGMSKEDFQRLTEEMWGE